MDGWVGSSEGTGVSDGGDAFSFGSVEFAVPPDNWTMATSCRQEDMQT